MVWISALLAQSKLRPSFASNSSTRGSLLHFTARMQKRNVNTYFYYRVVSIHVTESGSLRCSSVKENYTNLVI